MKFIKKIISAWKLFQSKKKREINEIKYLIVQMNQIQKKRCKLPKTQQRIITEKVKVLISSGKLDINLKIK